MAWKNVTLGEVLTESAILAEASSPDRRITVRLNVKGVEKRPVGNDKEGATKYFVRKAGQFIYGRQNLHKGAFGIITAELDGYESSQDLPAFDIAEQCEPAWLIYFLRQGNFYESLDRIARGIGSRRINPKDLYEVEMPLPPLDEQRSLLQTLAATDEAAAALAQDFANQATLLTRLRQAVLREAVQGRLVPQDATDEPAPALLARIRTEKQRLVKEKKLRADKPLPPLSEMQTSYEVPQGWAWCELKEVVESIFDGPFGSNLKTIDYTSAGIRVIRLENLGYGRFKNDKKTYITLEKYEGLKQHTIHKGDIIVGSFIAEGVKAVLIPKLSEIAIAKADCFCVRHNPSAIDNQFLTYLLGTSFISDGYLRIMRGMTRLRINTAQLKQTLIPLPPLAEQRRIVAKVTELLAHCTELEAELGRARQAAEALHAAALREAFQGAPVAVSV